MPDENAPRTRSQHFDRRFAPAPSVTSASCLHLLDLLEYAIKLCAVDGTNPEHDGFDVHGIANVLKRIAAQNQDVRKFSQPDRSEFVFLIQILAGLSVAVLRDSRGVSPACRSVVANEDAYPRALQFVGERDHPLNLQSGTQPSIVIHEVDNQLFLLRQFDRVALAALWPESVIPGAMVKT